MIIWVSKILKNEGSLILILFLEKNCGVLTFRYSKKNHIDSYKKKTKKILVQSYEIPCSGALPCTLIY
jgi:hypothetical protein